MIRKAKAVWRGTGRAGNGDLSTDSGVLADTPYSFKTRFENEKGTNPEELIAAAHAGCFTMALAFVLQAAGFTPTELATEAAVTLEPEGQGFRISRSALTLRAKCPISTKLRLPEWPAMPRRTVRSRRCSTPDHFGRQAGLKCPFSFATRAYRNGDDPRRQYGNSRFGRFAPLFAIHRFRVEHALVAEFELHRTRLAERHRAVEAGAAAGVAGAATCSTLIQIASWSQSMRISTTRWVWPEVSPFLHSARRERL